MCTRLHMISIRSEIKKMHVTLWCAAMNVCPESFACQQSRRLGGGNEVLHTGPHTPWWSCEPQGLRLKRNLLSQTSTVNILLLFPPSADGFGFVPFHLIPHICHLVYFLPRWEPFNFSLCALQSKRLFRQLSFVCRAPDCLYGTMGEHFLWL